MLGTVPNYAKINIVKTTRRIPIEVHFGNWEVHKCLSGESNGKR